MRTLLLHRERRIVIAALVFVLLVSAGCKSVPTTGLRLAPQPTPPGRWSEVTIDKNWLTVNVGLPYQGNPPYPVLLNPILPDHELLSRGIGVVRWRANWDALKALKPAPTPTPAAATPTPEKVGKWLLQADRPGLVGRGYFQLIGTEAHDSVPRVLDYLATLSDVDPHRIAISGSSTSGFTALEAMAEDPRLALGVVQVACGDYRSFLRSSSLALDDQARWLVDGRMVLDRDYAAELDASEPIRQADHFPPRPLLLVTGGEDRAIPPACVATTAERFEKAYVAAGAPSHFEWVEFADRGHNLGPAAEEVILRFLERWLRN